MIKQAANHQNLDVNLNLDLSLYLNLKSGAAEIDYVHLMISQGQNTQCLHYRSEMKKGIKIQASLI